MEAEIIESKKHLNNVAKLLQILHDSLKSRTKTGQVAAVSLCRVFCRLIAAGNLRPKERKTRRRLGRRQSSLGAGTGLFPSAWHKAVCWLPPAAASCDQLRREASPVVGEGLARRSAREVGGTNLNTTQQRKQTGGAKATASLTNFLNSAAMNFCP